MKTITDNVMFITDLVEGVKQDNKHYEVHFGRKHATINILDEDKFLESCIAHTDSFILKFITPEQKKILTQNAFEAVEYNYANNRTHTGWFSKEF